MHTYLNDLLCAAAPCDGELQDAIEHAIVTGAFVPGGDRGADLAAIALHQRAWLEQYRRMVEKNSTRLLTATEPLLAKALNLVA